jgi:hypothetical protein
VAFFKLSPHKNLLRKTVRVLAARDSNWGLLEEGDVVALQVELERAPGGKEPGSGRVVAVRVDGRQVLLVLESIL